MLKPECIVKSVRETKREGASKRTVISCGCTNAVFCPLVNACTYVLNVQAAKMPQKHANLTIQLGAVLCDGPQFQTAT